MALRHPEILELARRQGRVTVDGLAEHFGVTVQTVRRDLTDLAEAGQLTRVHGGAVLPSGTRNIAHEERAALNADAKDKIAAACAEMIPNGASLFLTIGTSTEAVARALRHHEGLLVITNNLTAVPLLHANPNTEVIVTGGNLRRTDGGLLGAPALETVHQFRPDFAVMSCSGLSAEGDMLDYDLDEVAISRAILNAARHPLLVADHSKFQRVAPARIGALSQVAHFVTDAALPKAAHAMCAAATTKLHVVA